jgi:argininosuccinate lyase
MPQKRNPFIFEHIQGRSAALLGAFVHCAGAMKSTPFTNSIAVSTEAIHPVRDALRQATEMIIATRLMVAGAIPNGDAMLRRAHSGLTSATAIANHLTKHANLDFRTAHRVFLPRLKVGTDRWRHRLAIGLSLSNWRFRQIDSM